MVGLANLKWINDDLYHGENKMISVEYFAEGLFHLRWPNGDRSVDFYNISWAKENAIRETLRELNGTTRVAA